MDRVQNKLLGEESRGLTGRAQDLLGRDRDQDRDLSSRDRDETETFAKLSETRSRRDLFWSRLYRDTWLIYAWYMHFTLCPKKESLRLG